MCWKKAHVLLYNILIQDSRSRNNGGYFMLQNTRTPLDGGWKLRYVENKRFRKENKDISTIAALKLTGWQSVDAVVPGNFELDFERAGLISDPFFGCNTIENEKFENLHLVYSRRFTLENEPDENTSSSSRASTLSRTSSSTENSSDRPTICSSPLSFAERT